MKSAFLNSAIFNSAILDKKISLNHSHSTWWWQPSWILPSWIQPFCSNLWLQLIQSDSNSFILTQLDEGSNLEFSQIPFSHLRFPSQTHSHLPRLVPTICTKKPSLIHSHSNWWWQPSWILPSRIQPFAQRNFTHAFSLKLMMAAILNSTILDWAILYKKKPHSFILTQLDDGSHLEFCHVGFRHCHLGFKHLVIFSQIQSKTLFLHSDPDSN